jgi:hypothetical protein
VTVIVIVIPQILNQIHRILIQVLLAMRSTRRGREVNAGTGRRKVLDGSREASTVVEDQDTSPKGLIIAGL